MTTPNCSQSPIFTTFGADETGWDIEAGGVPGISIVATAIQVWSCCQRVETTIGEAAATFNLPLPMIAQAVEYHPFMFVDGPANDPSSTIEHEGE